MNRPAMNTTIILMYTLDHRWSAHKSSVYEFEDIYRRYILPVPGNDALRVAVGRTRTLGSAKFAVWFRNRKYPRKSSVIS